MWELLQHLFPNLPALLSVLSVGDRPDSLKEQTEVLSALFWVVMAFVFVWGLVQLFRHRRHFRARLGALHELLSGQTKESLGTSRRETLKKALDLDVPDMGNLWREFDESLVSSADNHHVYNTLDAEHFFNSNSLAPGLTGSRLLAAMPSFLVAIGVLGTFVGLTIGLANLGANGDFSDVDEIREGITALIAGAAVAFMTSVWGVLFSFVFNFIEKYLERGALRQIRSVQYQIDFLYPRLPAEYSLVQISDNTRESKESLQELHERIGDRMQETLNGLTDSMQHALSDTLNNIMGPAIETLVNTTSKQSTQAMEALVTEFMGGISSAGREQGELMEKAAAQVNGALSGMSEQVGTLMESLESQRVQQAELSSQQAGEFNTQLQQLSAVAEERQQKLNEGMESLLGNLSDRLDAHQSATEQREEEQRARFNEHINALAEEQRVLLAEISKATMQAQEQSREMVERHRGLLDRFESVGDAVTTSSRHLDNSANQLGVLATNLTQSAEMLGEHMGGTLERIEALGGKNSEVATMLSQQVSNLETLQASLTDTTSRMNEAAKLAQTGFSELGAHQEQFLQSVRKQFEALGGSLRQQVEAIEKQAENWLQEYSAEVNQQVDERMQEWNKHSHQYADKMLQNVQAMSGILDELEAR